MITINHPLLKFAIIFYCLTKYSIISKRKNSLFQHCFDWSINCLIDWTNLISCDRVWDYNNCWQQKNTKIISRHFPSLCTFIDQLTSTSNWPVCRRHSGATIFYIYKSTKNIENDQYWRNNKKKLKKKIGTNFRHEEWKTRQANQRQPTKSDWPIYLPLSTYNNFFDIYVGWKVQSLR